MQQTTMKKHLFSDAEGICSEQSRLRGWNGSSFPTAEWRVHKETADVILSIEHNQKSVMKNPSWAKNAR